MEHKKAYDFLYSKCKDEGYIELANHIKHVGPLKLQVSNKNFVTHLSKIIIGQQVSVAAASAIWKRTKKIISKTSCLYSCYSSKPKEEKCRKVNSKT